MAVFRRRHIGFVFQNYNLVPILNVYENIILPVQLDGRKADKGFLEEIVHSLGLQDKLQNPPTISPAASSRESPLPAPCSQSQKSSWQTSRLGTWTAEPVKMCLSC